MEISKQVLHIQRDVRIDALRGIGILLMVLGHVHFLPAVIKKLIYAFHIPLFFYLSGYLFNLEKNLVVSSRAFLQNKFFRLIANN